MIEQSQTKLEYPTIYDLEGFIPIEKLYFVPENFYFILSDTYTLFVWWN